MQVSQAVRKRGEEGFYFCLQQKGNPFLPADCKIFSTPSPHRKVAKIPMPSYTKIVKKYKEKS
jgi:hypothetical protein